MIESKKKFFMLIILLIIIILIIFLVLHYIQNKNMQQIKSQVEAKLMNNTASSGKISDILDIDFDFICSFAPYTSKNEMKEILGCNSNLLRETLSEGTFNIVFTKDNQIILVLYGYGDINGYFIELPYGKYSADEIKDKEYVLNNELEYLYYIFEVT